jgi:hypothetical protein
MDLKEIKEQIAVVTADPIANKKMMEWIREPDDCFGRGYSEDSKYCRECSALSRLGNRYEPLFVFCKELIEGRENPQEEELSENVTTQQSNISDKLKLLKSKRF